MANGLVSSKTIRRSYSARIASAFPPGARQVVGQNDGKVALGDIIQSPRYLTHSPLSVRMCARAASGKALLGMSAQVNETFVQLCQVRGWRGQSRGGRLTQSSSIKASFCSGDAEFSWEISANFMAR